MNRKKIKSFDQFKKFIELLPKDSPGVSMFKYFEDGNQQRFESHFEQTLGDFRVSTLLKIKGNSNFTDMIYWVAFLNASPEELEALFSEVDQRLSRKKLSKKSKEVYPVGTAFVFEKK